MIKYNRKFWKYIRFFVYGLVMVLFGTLSAITHISSKHQNYESSLSKEPAAGLSHFKFADFNSMKGNIYQTNVNFERNKSYGDMEEDMSSYRKLLSKVRYSIDEGIIHPEIAFKIRDWITPNSRSKYSSVENSNILAARSFLNSASVNMNKAIIVSTSGNLEFLVNNNKETDFPLPNYPSETDLSMEKYLFQAHSMPHRYLNAPVKRMRLPKIDLRATREFNGPNRKTVLINQEDFQFDLDKRLTELSSMEIDKKIEIPEYSFYVTERFASFVNSLNNTRSKLPSLHSKKYFKEVDLKTNDDNIKRLGSHYDWRFFQGLKSEAEKTLILRRIAQAWLLFCHNEEIINWLSHGNLLSWYWQGTNFQWDHDIDIQLPIKQLEYLSINFNNSIILYRDESNYVGKYYLEVNPLFADKNRGEGKNIIDARFIDIDSGLYIDITAVYLRDSLSDRNQSQKGKSLIGFTARSDYQLMDKNFHKYGLQSTFNPLRLTIYEGRPAFVPHATDWVLRSEFPLGTISKTYTDYQFNQNFNGWVSKSGLNKIDRNTLDLWLKHNREQAQFCSNHNTLCNYKQRSFLGRLTKSENEIIATSSEKIIANGY